MQTLFGRLPLVALLCCSTTVLSAELRSFELPSEKRSLRNDGYQVSPKRSTNRTPEIYRKFEQRINQLDQEEKVEIRERFTEKQIQALRANKSDEARYYLNLIAIIDRSSGQ